jgi:hypothetical protein
MDVLEVDAVRCVLRRQLGVNRFAKVTGRQLGIRAVIGVGVLFLIRKGPEDVGKPPTRSLPVRLLPHEDATMLLDDRPNPKALGRVGTILIGNVPVGSVGSPTPPVERTFNTIALNPPAVANVGAQVGTMGVQDVQFPLVVSIGDEVLTEVPKRLHLPGRELDRPTDHVPARRLPGKRDLHVSQLHRRLFPGQPRSSRRRSTIVNHLDPFKN